MSNSGPIPYELPAGTHLICSCGQTSNAPFCNGAHMGSDWSPRVIEVSEPATVQLCGCASSANAPFCDGSHSRLL
ncbi:MAG: CDGSH iron-sulfur domain-containing protein [Synechococcus lacustris]